jgi:dipeptidyl aminopeptidase/acylaminoacyl peptidase
MNMRSAVSESGRRAWIARRDPQAYLSTVDLWAEDHTGIRRRCADSACSGTRSFGIQQLWWSFGQRDVLFLRREGWGGSQTALYRWRPGASKARRLLLTDDLLLGCELVERSLLCAREGATTPRRLIAIDLTSGREQTLVDPNPEFRALKLGPVERLHWRSPSGVETFGDLVLPPGYSGQRRLPLVIVQYISTGFLRGGVGDEYPIQLFAKHGYAVLSFHAPPAFAAWDGSKKDFEQAVAQTSRDWSTRRMIFTALESGIQMLVDRGIVDRARIGISGPSDGSTTVQFALINRPDLFAAASVSSCCTDPSFFMLYGGIGLAEERSKWGFPPARGPGSEAWQPLSLALNASTVKAPLLMQLADHEYLGGLDSFMSLRTARRPVELVVYPDEYHLMWQPAHRLAAYRRNLDWFDFWLSGREDPHPVDGLQYERWRAMQAAAAR